MYIANVTMELDYKFQLNLRRLSIVRIARLVLEQPSLKYKLRCLLASWFKKCLGEMQDFLSKNLQGIFSPYLKHLNHLKLPPFLTSEVRIATQSMVMKMLSWCIYITRRCNYDERKALSCFEKIYWTHYGSINYRRTFELSCLNNIELSNWNVFFAASDLCFTEHLQTHFKPTSSAFPKFVDSLLASYWQSYFSGNLTAYEQELNSCYEYTTPFSDIHNRTKIFVKLDVQPIPAEIFMLALAVSEGYIEAVKYFWRTLAVKHKRTCIILLMEESLFKNYFWQREQKLETFLYLLGEYASEDLLGTHQNMLESVLNIYHVNSYPFYKFISLFLKLWPWQEFFMPTLRELWYNVKICDLSNDPIDLPRFVSYISQSYYDFEKERLSTSRNLLLRNIWLSIPTHLKLLYKDISYARFIYRLVLHHQWKNIKLILCDEDLRPIKNGIILKIIHEYMVENEGITVKLQRISVFLNSVSESEFEKNNIKKQVCIWDYLHVYIQKDMLDNFFIWQCASHEEFSIIKTKINVMERWQCILEAWGVYKANEFLKWYFNYSQALIAKFKETVIDSYYPRDFVVDCWCRLGCMLQFEQPGLQPLNFLYWLLERDQVVTDFMQNVLANESSKISTYCIAHDIERRDEFLVWCSR